MITNKTTSSKLAPCGGGAISSGNFINLKNQSLKSTNSSPNLSPNYLANTPPANSNLLHNYFNAYKNQTLKLIVLFCLLTLLTSCGGGSSSSKTKKAQTPLNAGDNISTYIDSAKFKTSTPTGGLGSGALSYSSSNTDVATISATGFITIKKVGTTTITVTKAGDDSYQEASDSYTLVVTKKDQTPLNAGDNIDKYIDSTDFQTSAPTGGSSSGALSYSSSNTDVATISATGFITIKKAGTTTITVTKAGDDIYNLTSDNYILTIKEQSAVSPADIRFEVLRNGNLTTATKAISSLTTTKVNYINILIDEDYDPDTALELTVEVRTHDAIIHNQYKNYSDSDKETFTYTAIDGNRYNFALNIIRKPILISNQPSANTDTEYETSGASAISIRKFIQTDYFYTPSVLNDVITDNPAPTFALFPETATPTADDILNSPIRVLRNFTTTDGTTLFFNAVDDGTADDEWTPVANNTGATLNINADSLVGLTPSTNYNLYWAIETSDGNKHSGLLSAVTTSALPTTEPTTGDGFIKYFGLGGMKVHPISGADIALTGFYNVDPTAIKWGIVTASGDDTLANINGGNPAFKVGARYTAIASPYGRSSLIIESKQFVDFSSSEFRLNAAGNGIAKTLRVTIPLE